MHMSCLEFVWGEVLGNGEEGRVIERHRLTAPGGQVGECESGSCYEACRAAMA